MSRLNAIQSAILELNGGAYHNLFDEYAYKKYDFENIHALGVQSATNKSTIGVPDSYVVNEDGTYTLLMYGTVQGSSYTKIKEDIESCLKEYKKK